MYIKESDEDIRKLERKFKADKDSLSQEERIKLLKAIQSQGRLEPRVQRDIKITDKAPDYHDWSGSHRKFDIPNDAPQGDDIKSQRLKNLFRRDTLRYDNIYDRDYYKKQDNATTKKQNEKLITYKIFNKNKEELKKIRKNLRILRKAQELGIEKLPPNMTESDEEIRGLERKVKAGGALTREEKSKLFRAKKLSGELDKTREQPHFEFDRELTPTHRRYMTTFAPERYKSFGKLLTINPNDSPIDKKRKSILADRIYNRWYELRRRRGEPHNWEPKIREYDYERLVKDREDKRKQLKALNYAKRIGLDNVNESDEEVRRLQKEYSHDPNDELIRQRLNNARKRLGLPELPRTSNSFKNAAELAQNLSSRLNKKYGVGFGSKGNQLPGKFASMMAKKFKQQAYDIEHPEEKETREQERRRELRALQRKSSAKQDERQRRMYDLGLPAGWSKKRDPADYIDPDRVNESDEDRRKLERDKNNLTDVEKIKLLYDMKRRGELEPRPQTKHPIYKEKRHFPLDSRGQKILKLFNSPIKHDEVLNKRINLIDRKMMSHYPEILSSGDYQSELNLRRNRSPWWNTDGGIALKNAADKYRINLNKRNIVRKQLKVIKMAQKLGLTKLDNKDLKNLSGT